MLFDSVLIPLVCGAVLGVVGGVDSVVASTVVGFGVVVTSDKSSSTL